MPTCEECQASSGCSIMKFMSDHVIEIVGLSKRYSGSDNYALKDLTLGVKPGETYGFLGPNGAGKSTTIRILMNFLQPTSGRASVSGKDIVKDSVEIKKSVGYLSSDIGMYRKMTGRQYLDYMSELLPPASRAYRQELTKRLNIDLSKKLGELSRGNRQKVNIIQAFMHQPQVLILDEPTSGLDPLMQEEFYKLLEEAKQRQAAIFTSSHILGEVQKMCDRVGIIREGRLIGERDIAEMAREAAQTFDIIFNEKVPLTKLKAIKGVKAIESSDRRVTVHLHGEMSPLLAELAKHKVTSMDTHQLDLEEMFLQFYNSKGSK